MSEIFRAGIVSLPKGQREAAAAIGLRTSQTFRLVLVPQAVRIMLPALISQLVTILKETSLGFIIGYTELLRSGRVAVEYLGGQYAIPVYTLIAVIYLLVNISLSNLARRIDR
ncbi:ABC transporter permease subunit [Nocardia sp. CA-120079]|uniref:ABC transporter permease subunit n=1 Tax=Nocardia sp. CA-120079 TaxID=3239974 RepID=UPI003D9721B8